MKKNMDENRGEMEKNLAGLQLGRKFYEDEEE